MNRIWKMSLIIVGIILLDQFTKGVVQSKFYLGESIPVIEGIFNFTYVKNPGAAFGMGAAASDLTRKILFLALPVLACFWLLYSIWITRKEKLIHCLSYSLIFSGAVGNLIDRFSLRYVVDFLDFHWKNHHFPAFNIADSAITIGVTLLVLDSFLELIGERKKKVNQEV